MPPPIADAVLDATATVAELVTGITSKFTGSNSNASQNPFVSRGSTSASAAAFQAPSSKSTSTASHSLSSSTSYADVVSNADVGSNAKSRSNPISNSDFLSSRGERSGPSAYPSTSYGHPNFNSHPNSNSALIRNNGGRNGPPANHSSTYSYQKSNSNSAPSRSNGERSGPPPRQLTYSSSRVDRPITTPTQRPMTKIYTDDRRAILRSIADETISILKKEIYSYNGADYKLSGYISNSQNDTRYYAPDSFISSWATTQVQHPGPSPAHISVLQISTLDAARLLENMYKMNGHQRGKTGVLNFASATQPGGGFKNGAEAQEESIARSSTLYPVLIKSEATKFYKLHQREMGHSPAYYTHAIIYSPEIVVFRDDDGVWTYPFPVDVLSCAAVNAGEVRKASNTPVMAGLEVEIEKEMAERMGRILYVFEQQGIRNLVLGTFGAGVFRNNVAIVARLWAHLLAMRDGRFEHSFDRVIFAITGEEMFAQFQSAFDAWAATPQPARAMNGSSGGGGNFGRDLVQL